MINPISSPSLPNGTLVPPQPAQAAGGGFAGTLEAMLDPLQQVPLVGTIYRAVSQHPLQILGAAAHGFLAGGPIGAAAGAGLAVISDQVSGDSTVVPRTEAALKASGPFAGS
ncbi:MAG: hypothetical protein ACREFP_05500 [Acetobacteraceae bacterium]